MQLMSEITLPSAEDVCRLSPTVEDREADSKLLQYSPWIAENGNLTLFYSERRGVPEMFLHYLIAAVTKKRPVRCFLRRQRKEEFLHGLMRSFSGLTVKDRVRFGDVKCLEEMMAKYRTVEGRVRSLDLGVMEMAGWSIEDVIEYFDSHSGVSLYDSVVVIDSLTSLTTRATEKWEIAQAVIGARIRDWMDSKNCSVVLLDRLPPGQFRGGHV